MANGDASRFAGVWSQGASAVIRYLTGWREAGWGRVQESFQQVGQAANAGRIRLDDWHIRVTEVFAYELGVGREVLKLDGQQAAVDGRATNIHRHEAGKWKIVPHYSDLPPARLKDFNRLLAKSRAT